MRITFQAIRRNVTKTVKCECCGKSLRRSTTIENTVNPWNRNDDGTVKTASQVRDDVDAQAKAWEPANRTCKTCDERAA